jgi:formate C-acetyltransferase
MFIEAAALVQMPQPTFNFRLQKDLSLAGEAAHKLGSQCNFFNNDLIRNKLLNSGFSPETAESFTFTACNRVDVPGVLYNKMYLIDIFDNPVSWFREALFAVSSEAEILPEFRKLSYRYILDDICKNRKPQNCEEMCFHLESLGIQSCIQTCRDINRYGAENYRWMHRMFAGIGTMADSLAAIKELRKEFSYAEILHILECDFEGYEPLRQKIRNSFPKYGNGDAATDGIAAEIGNILIDAFEEAAQQEGFIPMPSFYSLFNQYDFGKQTGSTPDGRKNGDILSENQSPSFGMDHEGPTSLLKSVTTLPLARCISGGLNLKFASRPEARDFEALLKSFFSMGGQHLGFTVVDRQTLEEARENPEKYRSLYVRVTGFSEYFTVLSPQMQQELIDRTEY